MKINRTAKIAYHCNTEELALLFLKECDNKHIYWPWPNREKATSKTNWTINKENTCYVVEGNTLGVAARTILKQYGIKIIECTKEMFIIERRELKDELRSKVEYIHEQDEVIKEYKHRAEVAERALDKATELAYTYRTQDDTLSCSSCSSCPFDSIFDRCKERGLYEDCSKRWKEELLQQSEKELQEERKK